MNACLLANRRPSTTAPFGSAQPERDAHNPLHWMPVPYPGLSAPRHHRFMVEVDRRPYTAPCWLGILRRPSRMEGLHSAVGDREREPNNPLHWMPVLPPALLRY
jgi:hypothetical protein